MMKPEVLAAYDAARAQAAVDGHAFMTNSAKCLPEGMPAMIDVPGTLEILDAPQGNEIIFFTAKTTRFVGICGGAASYQCKAKLLGPFLCPPDRWGSCNRYDRHRRQNDTELVWAASFCGPSCGGRVPSGERWQNP